jgi:hypothetical protein
VKLVIYQNYTKMHSQKNTGCPTSYRTRHFFKNFTTNEDISTKFEADLPHCVRNVKEKNVLLFLFLCNIFIVVRIIKEIPGSVASGTFLYKTFFLSSNAGPNLLSALEVPDRHSLSVASLPRTWAIGRVYGTAINEQTRSSGVFSIDLTSSGIQS